MALSHTVQRATSATNLRSQDSQDSSSGDAASLLGMVTALSECGRYGEALALVSSEIARRPGDGELLFTRATVWFDWGRLREAYTGFLQAEAAGVSRVALYLNMAWSCHLLRMGDDAERHARRAIAREPANVAAHFGLGAVLLADEAISRSRRSVRTRAGILTGSCAGRCGDRAMQARAARLRRGGTLDAPGRCLGTGLPAVPYQYGRGDREPATLRRNFWTYWLVPPKSRQAKGAPPVSITDTGFALVSMGRYVEALEVFRRGLPQLPDPRAHGYYAFLLLVLGRLREGWVQYEFRWMQDPHLSRRPVCPRPRWAGQDLIGKTLLVLDEQGAGDIFHFARFIRLLKAMGARVLLFVRPEMASLAAQFAGVDRVYSRPELPLEFDYHIHLMSIPQVLGLGMDDIPADVPYVKVDVDKARAWAGRIHGSGLKVGLAWAGNPKYPRDNFRSIALEKLSSLFDVQGVRFYSLQKPLKEGELREFPTLTTMVNLDADLSDFTETAAAIDRLDLVICVDTAIAHLAGALGKPVWLMLPEIGDFRWLDGRRIPGIRRCAYIARGSWANGRRSSHGSRLPSNRPC